MNLNGIFPLLHSNAGISQRHPARAREAGRTNTCHQPFPSPKLCWCIAAQNLRSLCELVPMHLHLENINADATQTVLLVRHTARLLRCW